MQSLELTIDGMTCAHCVSGVQKALANIDGVSVERVSVGGATVIYDPRRAAPERILAAVADEGYTPHIRNS